MLFVRRKYFRKNFEGIFMNRVILLVLFSWVNEIAELWSTKALYVLGLGLLLRNLLEVYCFTVTKQIFKSIFWNMLLNVQVRIYEVLL